MVEMKINFNKEHKSLASVHVFFSGEFYMPHSMDELILSLTEAKKWLERKQKKTREA